MNGVVTQVITKLWSVWFHVLYSRSFKALGSRAFLFRPFRIDGIEGVEIGAQTVLQSGTWIYCSGIDGIAASLKFGKGCVFGYNNHITAVREVVIEDYVLTANNVYISDNLHCYEDVTKPIMHQPVKFKKAVHIGEGSWIGENVSIIGAKIGKNCVIGSNAVVTKDIPDYSVAVGAPAIVIKRYDLMLKQWINVTYS